MKNRKRIKWNQVFSICPGCGARHQLNTIYCLECIMNGKQKHLFKDWSNEEHGCPHCYKMHTEKTRICRQCLDIEAERERKRRAKVGYKTKDYTGIPHLCRCCKTEHTGKWSACAICLEKERAQELRLKEKRTHEAI